MTVLDLSNYDADTFDPDCMIAAGITGIVLGCQRKAVAQTMAAKARAAGLPILGTYAFLYFGIDTIGQTKAATEVALEFSIPRVWLDCESTGENDNADGPAQRCMELRACIALVNGAGLSAGIYTGAWWWPSNMATEEFAYLPLWHAAYGAGGGPANPVMNVDYGGWDAVAMHQYTSTLPVCGRNRDANYVFVEESLEDTVLREALIKREQMRHVAAKIALDASDPDLPTVEAAWADLKAKGLIA